MPRTKGARDIKPRTMNPASLAQMPHRTPGYGSATIRIFATLNAIQWFSALDSKARGAVVDNARNTSA